jgi:hypothetical protein
VYAEDEEDAMPKVDLYSGLFAVIGVICGLSMAGMVSYTIAAPPSLSFIRVLVDY